MTARSPGRRGGLAGGDPPRRAEAAERQDDQHGGRAHGGSPAGKRGRIGGLEDVVRRGGDEDRGGPGGDRQRRRAAGRDVEDKRIDIGKPDDRRQPEEAAFAERAPHPGGRQRDHHEERGEDEGGAEFQWVGGQRTRGRPQRRRRRRRRGVRAIPQRGERQPDQRQRQQRRRQGGGERQVEQRDDDQHPQVHDRGRQHDAGLRLQPRRGLGAGAARQDDGRRGRGIKPAQHRDPQPAARRREVALQQVAGVGEGAYREDREPHLVRRQLGEAGHRLIRQERQDQPGQDEEFAGGDEFADLDAPRDGVQPLARGQQQ